VSPGLLEDALGPGGALGVAGTGLMSVIYVVMGFVRVGDRDWAGAALEAPYSPA
jgi:hypothetical protein